MTKNNPAVSALRDQIDAATAESDDFLTARGASAPVLMDRPAWQRLAMEALLVVSGVDLSDCQGLAPTRTSAVRKNAAIDGVRRDALPAGRCGKRRTAAR